ncbi:MAG TPA: tripartite tricarboxylate transporter substrate binding protein [Burkholderiales bacterium]|nr:tripartite tricarboxylate transporter substrate binding protein [Burkholderiales bacterium]
MKTTSFRTLLAAVLLAFSFGAAAQAWPSKPIKVVVPYPAGGFYDTIARLVGAKMTESLGQPIVVENRVGAGGIIGTDYVAKAAPDGYTLIVGGIGPHGINAGLYPKLPYDPVRDFEPIVHVVNAANILVVHPSVQARSVRELVALAKAKPGELNYASNGTGTSPHLAAEMFASAMNIKLTHIPYKGSAPAVTAMLGGQTHMAFNNAGDIIEHIRAGKLHPLAVTGAKRLPVLPDVPTMQESGVPDYEAVAWWAYFAPAGTPRDIVTKLNAEINRILQVPEVRSRLSVQGSAEVVGGTPEQLAAFVKNEIAKWTKVIKASGAKVD